METLIKIDSDLLEKAKIFSNFKTEKQVTEEALKKYILLNNIINRESKQYTTDNKSSNSVLFSDYLELKEYNKKYIRKVDKDINLSKLADEVNNDIF
jgi:hypothetical protein